MKGPNVAITIFKIRITEMWISDPRKIQEWHVHTQMSVNLQDTAVFLWEHSSLPKGKTKADLG